MVLAAVVRRLGHEIEGSRELGRVEEVAALVRVGEAAAPSALTALVGDSLGFLEVARGSMPALRCGSAAFSSSEGFPGRASKLLDQRSLQPVLMLRLGTGPYTVPVIG